MTTFNRYIFWTQGDGASQETNRILIDGRNATVDERREALSHLSTTQSKRWRLIVQGNQIKGLPSSESAPSPSLKIFKGKGGEYLVSSHFKEKDTSNRNIVFAICSKGGDFSEIATRLEEAASLAGFTCNSDDIGFLKVMHGNTIHRTKRNFFLFSSLTIIIILLIIYYAKQ